MLAEHRDVGHKAAETLVSANQGNCSGKWSLGRDEAGGLFGAYYILQSVDRQYCGCRAEQGQP